MPALREIIDLSLQVSPADPVFIEGEHFFFAGHEIKAHGIIRVIVWNSWSAGGIRCLKGFRQFFRGADTAGAAAELTAISLDWTEIV